MCLQQCSENPEFGTTLVQRLNQSRTSAVLQSNLITITLGTAEARRLKATMLITITACGLFIWHLIGFLLKHSRSNFSHVLFLFALKKIKKKQISRRFKDCLLTKYCCKGVPMI